MIILGKADVVVSTKTNTIEKTEEEYLVGKLLKNLGLTDTQELQETLVETSESLISMSSSSGESSKSPNKSISTEEDGLEYLAGWVAKKLKNTHPHLGNYTYQTHKENIHNYSLPNWLSFLSFGGLTQPSDEFLNQCKELNKLFVKYFGKNINYKKNILKKIVEKIKSVTNIDEIIIKKFILQRIYIRINFFNTKREEELKEKIKSRKRKQKTDLERKVDSKMRKIVT